MKEIELSDQLNIFEKQRTLVHYYDKAGALRTGYLIRKIKKGKKRGKFVVEEMNGKLIIPAKIRNIETQAE